MDTFSSLRNDPAGSVTGSSEIDKSVGFKPMASGVYSATEGRHIGKPPPPAPHHPAPSTPIVSIHSVRYGLVQKVQALTLLSEGFPMTYITQRTGIPSRSLARIRAVATQRGYRPDQDARILDTYVVDGKRSGRPRKNAAETQVNEGVEGEKPEDEQKGDEELF